LEDRPLSDALLTLDRLTRRLRRDCPWDREQDERSIVPHTLEEAYELADAAHAGNHAKLVDELGDVLFQVCFLALLLEERGKGDLATVAKGSTEKLVRRHPHVFGHERHGEDALAGLPTAARTPAQVRENWDAIKRAEEASDGEPFAALPDNLPALLYARKLQRRVAGGADRSDPAEALARVRESLEDAERAVAGQGPDAEARERTQHGSEWLYERVGDLLFCVVELARSLQVDPEVALRRSADRFRERAGKAS
jgi:MazG family protein